MIARPSETIQATISALIGALLIIVGVVQGGFDFGDLKDPEVAGAISIIFGFVSAVVTWYVARKQRAATLGSATDGAVLPAPPT